MVWLSELEGANPWWSDVGAIETDKHIVEWEESRYHWMPPVIDDFTLDKDAVYTLRGARRIGKTTAVKLLIRTLLKGGTRPQNILFYPCDLVGDARGLYGVVREYLKHRGRQKSERTFIFLDELSGVKKWQVAIKHLWDTNSLKDCTVIGTGSHTIDLAQSAEHLPGRRGRLNEAMDKIMQPLSFLEYVMTVDEALSEKIAPALKDGQRRDRQLDSVFSGRILPALKRLSKDVEALNRHLDDYAMSGGIPWIVNQLGSGRKISEESYVACLRSMLDDAASFGRQPETVKGIAGALVGSIGRPSSWTSLAKDVGLSGATSAGSYTSVLEDMFILSIMYQYNAKSKSTMPGRKKKIYFTDPFYLHTLHGWIVSTEAHYASQKFLSDGGNRGRVVEGIVAGHLIRMAFRRSPKKPRFLYTNYLAYWRYGPEKEVDFVYNDGHVEVPIEVKFGANTSRRDLAGIIAFKKATRAKNGLILTRDSLSVERECLRVPASLFLLLA